MPKTKEQIAAYNKEYFARPEVIARAKERNAQRRHIRAAYKLTEAGKEAEKRYRKTLNSKQLQEASRIRNRYGMTNQQLEDMKLLQGGKCSICRLVPAKWHIDHDHVTGKVRGLLCSQCNMALGLFKDDPIRISKAIEYLSFDKA